MTKKHYLDEIDEKNDKREQILIKNIFQDLMLSLEDKESYFLQETIKKIHLDGQDSYKKIQKTIGNIINTDKNQYMQNTDIYKKYAFARQTLGDAVDLYIDSLTKKITEWLSAEEIDHLVSSYMGFLQKKEDFLQKGKIDPKKSDIDNFIDIIGKFIKEEKTRSKMSSFIHKYLISNIENKKIEAKKGLIENLAKKTLQFPKQNNLSSQERKDLKYLKKGLKNIVGNIFYEEIIIDFIDQTEESKRFSLDEVIESLMKKYKIYTDKEQLSDYLQRMKSLLSKKK